MRFQSTCALCPRSGSLCCCRSGEGTSEELLNSPHFSAVIFLLAEPVSVSSAPPRLLPTLLFPFYPLQSNSVGGWAQSTPLALALWCWWSSEFWLPDNIPLLAPSVC